MKARANAERVDLSCGLIEVDASWSMSTVGRICERQGLIFPMARPWPRFSIAEACTRLPGFADAFVVQAEGSVDEVPLSTTRAPRAAMGPDLLGLAFARAPMAVLDRVRLRVWERARVNCWALWYPDISEGVHAIMTRMSEGRDGLIDACMNTDQVCLRIVSSRGDLPPSAERCRDHVSPSMLRVRSDVPLLWGDRLLLEGELQRGMRLLCAPETGRACVLRDVHFPRARLPFDQACARAAQALTVGEFNHDH